MAILHRLRMNNSTTDDVAGTWTITGTTSQATQGYTGLYNRASGNNRYISETNTGTPITFAVWTKCGTISDGDGKVIDARGSGSVAILAYDSGTTAYWYTGNGSSVVRVSVAKGVWNRLVGTRDGTTGIFYNNGKEIGRYTGTGNSNYTSIRIGQENSGSPNRRYVGDIDEISIDRIAWSPANMKNDFGYWKGFF